MIIYNITIKVRHFIAATSLRWLREKIFFLINQPIFSVLFWLLCFTPSLSQDSLQDKILNLPHVHFKKNSFSLDKKNRTALDSIFKITEDYSNRSLVVGISDYGENVIHITLMWDRLNTVIRYLFKKGIDTGRVVFNYWGDGEYDAIYFKLEVIEKLQDLPPHPNLRRQESGKPDF